MEAFGAENLHRPVQRLFGIELPRPAAPVRRRWPGNARGRTRCRCAGRADVFRGFAHGMIIGKVFS
ncbi:hypothetical protein SODG_001268 [Sodalis praecaptivus]